jgi:hypothetical protein
MKIRISWFAGEEYERPTLAFKTWELDVSDFNGEIPRLGDKVSLSLPIVKDDSTVSSTELSFWTFKVTEREWCPEYPEKTVNLQVQLDNPKDFWTLSNETKNKLVERLEEEEIKKREDSQKEFFASVNKILQLPSIDIDTGNKNP